MSLFVSILWMAGDKKKRNVETKGKKSHAKATGRNGK
jgi:hypothetical protein